MADRVWPTRFERLMAELGEYDADVICLQGLIETITARHYALFVCNRGYAKHV
jgi:mRNA deadenylase 3'-5' endonuclease subunit Ccr4